MRISDWSSDVCSSDLDIAILPIQMVTTQLAERHRLVQGIHFEVDGVPISVEQARHLFDRNPYQFQQWFVERVGGFPMQKKVADRGIDGRLYFQTNMKLEQIILSVKGGKLKQIGRASCRERVCQYV